ncbi:hypothetical protein LTY62_00345, partial [Limosilactobacillus balticus]|uniref:hypothetical protein n=1 Tax=Limosilactobacillus balticus TaxID=2759747 RepID=UPI001E3A2674
RADYRSYLDSSLVVIFHVIFLLFIKVVEAERKQKFSPSLIPTISQEKYLEKKSILNQPGSSSKIEN